jgi:hypothetical protein
MLRDLVILIVFLLCFVADITALLLFTVIYSKRGKAILVRDHRGPYGCEMSGLPHFLDSWLRDGGEVVSLTCRQPFTP